MAALTIGVIAGLLLATTASAAPPPPTPNAPTPFPLGNHSHDGSVEVRWTGDPADAGYLCAVVPWDQPAPDPDDATQCESGWSTGPLDPGRYKAWIWADDSGALSPPAEREFLTFVDGVAAISGSPAAGAVTADPTANLSLALENPDDVTKDYEAGAPDEGFACQLDASTVPGQPSLSPFDPSPAWSRCRSDVPLTLTDGTHTFVAMSRIRVGGKIGYSMAGPPASRTWTVDTQRPDTAITAGLRRSVRRGGRLPLEFSGADPAPGTELRFECKAGRGDWERCTSPYVVRPRVLGRGVFKVRAVDAAGNADRKPASHRFRVVPRRRR